MVDFYSRERGATIADLLAIDISNMPDLGDMQQPNPAAAPQAPLVQALPAHVPPLSDARSRAVNQHVRNINDLLNQLHRLVGLGGGSALATPPSPADAFRAAVDAAHGRMLQLALVMNQLVSARSHAELLRTYVQSVVSLQPQHCRALLDQVGALKKDFCDAEDLAYGVCLRFGDFYSKISDSILVVNRARELERAAASMRNGTEPQNECINLIRALERKVDLLVQQRLATEAPTVPPVSATPQPVATTTPIVQPVATTTSIVQPIATTTPITQPVVTAPPIVASNAGSSTRNPPTGATQTIAVVLQRIRELMDNANIPSATRPFDRDARPYGWTITRDQLEGAVTVPAASAGAP